MRKERFLIQLADGSQASGVDCAPADIAPDTPLIIALPGGSNTAGYFDVQGHSLLDRAASQGIRAIALDRPGYGETTPLAEPSLANNARQLLRIVEHLWSERGGGAPGVVLIGHSIGGAIAIEMA